LKKKLLVKKCTAPYIKEVPAMQANNFRPLELKTPNHRSSPERPNPVRQASNKNTPRQAQQCTTLRLSDRAEQIKPRIALAFVKKKRAGQEGKTVRAKQLSRRKLLSILSMELYHPRDFLQDCRCFYLQEKKIFRHSPRVRRRQPEPLC
jgi:hypothetical protein